MSDKYRVDEPTGTEFVGHEWDGIEELNTPLPCWWLWTFYASIVWSVIYVVLYPAWPLLSQGTEGVLGWTSRGQLQGELTAADQARKTTVGQIAATDTADLLGNEELLNRAISGGAAAFKQHCVQCHGAGAAGYEQYGYPNLNDDDWIWGGTISDIETTLTHGVRWDGSDQTRSNFMPAFDGILSAKDADAVAEYVLSLSGKGTANAGGKKLFEANCVACHQAGGRGNRALGAPALNDAIWLYGGSKELVTQQILKPRHGVMPGWTDKLDPVTIKMLAVYVHSRGGGEAETKAPPTKQAAADLAGKAVARAEAGDNGQR